MAKRCFDVLFSMVVLLILSPLLLIIALLIITTSCGPVFYSHLRIGKGGKPFACLKFRTMYKDASEKLATLLAQNPQLQKEWLHYQKLRDDPRITKVGKFLRKTSLDELPQFWNVLQGDLSVVGPRPVVEEELARHFGGKAGKILSVRPGITGLWQTSGRNDTSYKERIALDEQYVDKHNLLLDVKLILKTIPCIILSKGSY